MAITVEIKGCGDAFLAELSLCVDDAGLDELVRMLNSLRGRSDHVHLMTAEWSGRELSSAVIGGPDHQIINHMRIVNIEHR